MVETTTVAPTREAADAGRKVARVLDQEVRKLALHSSHYAAGFIGALVVGLVSFPIFTRVFPVAEYGAIDLAQKLLILLWAASKMGLQNAALRFHDESSFSADKSSARRYYSTLFFGIAGSSVAVVTLFLVAVAVAPQSLVSAPVLTLIHLIAAVVVLRSLASMLWSFLRIEERTTVYNATAIGEKVATVAAVCVLLPWSGHTSQTYFTGVIVVQALLVASLTIPLLRRKMLVPWDFDSKLFRTSIAFGLPLVTYEWAFGILGSTDRLMVRNFLGADALGYYSVASGLAQQANDLLVTPLTLALTPLYMRLWNTEGRGKTVKFLTFALDLYLMSAIGILAIATASAKHLVVLLASSKYAGADHLIPVLLAAFLIYTMNIFLGAGFFIQKRTMHLAGLLMGSAVINIALNWVLLPTFGLPGGAAATLLSYSIFVFCLARASRSLLPLGMDVRAIGRYLLAGLLAWLAASCLHVTTAIAGLLLTATAATAVYCAVLYALDARVRGAARWLVGWLQDYRHEAREAGIQ